MHRRRDGIVAKNKVINTVLTVQDKLSGGLVEAAKNAKKSGKAIDGSMLSATRSVVAFKNKSVKALTYCCWLCCIGRRDRGIPRGAGQAERRISVGGLFR